MTTSSHTSPFCTWFKLSPPHPPPAAPTKSLSITSLFWCILPKYVKAASRLMCLDTILLTQAEEQHTGQHLHVLFSLEQHRQRPAHQLKRGQKSPQDGCTPQVRACPYLVIGTLERSEH